MFEYISYLSILEKSIFCNSKNSSWYHRHRNKRTSHSEKTARGQHRCLVFRATPPKVRAAWFYSMIQLMIIHLKLTQNCVVLWISTAAAICKVFWKCPASFRVRFYVTDHFPFGGEWRQNMVIHPPLACDSAEPETRPSICLNIILDLTSTPIT